jgi:hypothetical protein
MLAKNRQQGCRDAHPTNQKASGLNLALNQKQFALPSLSALTQSANRIASS